MNDLTETAEQPQPDGRAPWMRPAVVLVGTISLVVRGGSAMGKISGTHDGDNGNFQCFPSNCGQPNG